MIPLFSRQRNLDVVRRLRLRSLRNCRKESNLKTELPKKFFPSNCVDNASKRTRLDNDSRRIGTHRKSGVAFFNQSFLHEILKRMLFLAARIGVEILGRDKICFGCFWLVVGHVQNVIKSVEKLKFLHEPKKCCYSSENFQSEREKANYTCISMTLNELRTGQGCHASFSKNIRSSSILVAWCARKYERVCFRSGSFKLSPTFCVSESFESTRQKSSPMAMNLKSKSTDKNHKLRIGCIEVKSKQQFIVVDTTNTTCYVVDRHRDTCTL